MSIAKSAASGWPVLTCSCPSSAEAVVLAFETTGTELVAKQPFASITAQIASKVIICAVEVYLCFSMRRDLCLLLSICLQCSELLLTICQTDSKYPPVSWELTRFTLDMAAQPAKIPLHVPQPVIDHQFNQPQRPPLRLLSVLFTSSMLLPLVYLLISLHGLGVNNKASAGILLTCLYCCALPCTKAIGLMSSLAVQGFPTCGSSLAFASAFHMGLLALGAAYTAFWLHLDLLTTLVPLTLLGVWLSISGYGLLSSLSASRLKQA